MADRHHHIAAVVGPTGQIHQIVDQYVDPRTEELIESVDGQVDPTFAAIMSQSPMLGWSTRALATALGYCGIGGLAMTGTGTDIYFQPSAQGGTRTTTDCTKFATTNGIVCIESISAQQGAPASLTQMAYAISPDGTTAPMAVTQGVTLPAQTATREYYTLGPVFINGTKITSLKGWDFGLNKNVIVDAFDGFAYPTLAYILGRLPTFNVNFTDIEQVQTLGLQGAQGSTDSVLYLRKMTENGFPASDATEAHAKIAIDAGQYTIQRVSGSHGSPASSSIKISPTYDGTNAIVAISTGVAIA
jgi:hypothetical protein